MSLPPCCPLQGRTVAWACVFLSQCNLSIYSSVFSLTTSFFIQCQENLVQRQRSQRHWNSSKFHENYMLCKKKNTKEIIPRKTPSWRQHCSLSCDRQKQQRVSKRMGTEKRNPQSPCHRRSLHIALYPKMQFTGNQPLVPAFTKLRVFLWVQHICGNSCCLALTYVIEIHSWVFGGFVWCFVGGGWCLCFFLWFFWGLVVFFLRCGGQRASGLYYWAWLAPSAKVPAKTTRLMVFCKGKVCLLSSGLKLILGRMLTQFLTFGPWLFW